MTASHRLITQAGSSHPVQLPGCSHTNRSLARLEPDTRQGEDIMSVQQVMCSGATRESELQWVKFKPTVRWSHWLCSSSVTVNNGSASHTMIRFKFPEGEQNMTDKNNIWIQPFH